MPKNLNHARHRVKFVTNFAPPYRIPLWRELGDKTELSVRLLEDVSTAPDGVNRQSDWNPHSRNNVSGFTLTLPSKPSRYRGRRLEFLSIRDCISITNCDCIILGGWERLPYFQIRLLASVRKVPCVGFYESVTKSQRFSRGPIDWIRTVFFRSLAAVVVPGPTSHRTVLGMGVPEDRIFEGFNAVDVDKIHACAIEHRSNLHSNGPTQMGEGHNFIFVGQLIPRKNLESLTRAVTEIARPFSLTVVGKGELEARINQDLETGRYDSGRISLIGQLEGDSLYRTLAEHHTLVLPSHEEVWGLVVNEALAAGLQVIVNEECGVSESVKDMQGVFVYNGTDQSLMRTMEAAADAWRGWIADPAILSMTPRRFSRTFFEAIQYAADRDRSIG